MKKHNCKNTADISNNAQNRIISGVNTTKRKNDNVNLSDIYGFKGFQLTPVISW